MNRPHALMRPCSWCPASACSFGARMTSVGPLLTAEMRAEAERRRAHRPRRWDGAQLELFEGTYGEYLLSKVSKVFPDLARCSLTQH